MIIEINDENAKLVYPYFVNLHAVVPYLFLCTQEDFTQSLLHETSEGDEMFAQLYTYAIMQGTKVKGLVQYGIPNYEVNYDGERLTNRKIGVLRNIYFGLDSFREGRILVNRALEYFKQQGIESIRAFPHEYGMRVFGYHGKLYKSEYLVRFYLAWTGWKVNVESIYYTKSLKRLTAQRENRGYSFKEEQVEEDIQFFTICKYNKVIGGVQFHYVNHGKCAYMDFIYLSEEYQGRGWGSEAMWQMMILLKSRGIQRIDTDMEKMNAIGQRFLEKCEFGKLGHSYSYERK